MERDPYLASTNFVRNITDDVRTSRNFNKSDRLAFYLGPNPTDELPVQYARLVILASKRQRYCAIKKGTNLSFTHIEKLDEKSFYLLEKLTRSRDAGCLQSTLNKIDLTNLGGFDSGAAALEDGTPSKSQGCI